MKLLRCQLCGHRGYRVTLRRLADTADGLVIYQDLPSGVSSIALEMTVYRKVGKRKVGCQSLIDALQTITANWLTKRIGRA